MIKHTLSLLALCSVTYAMPPLLKAWHAHLPAQTSVSYVTMDVEHGTRLQAYRADEAHVPANTMKLLTAVGVLSTLGAIINFRQKSWRLVAKKGIFGMGVCNLYSQGIRR